MITPLPGKVRISLVVVLAAIILTALGAFLAGLWPRSPRIRNVLLISIDTCRADFLSCYGYPLETTPNIDALARQGMLFENAISPVPFTLPAHCSMLTGTIPPRHRVMDNSDYTLDKSNVTLAEILKAEGFNTAAFVSSFILDARFGIGQGFDTYEDDFEKSTGSTGINERLGAETTDLALQWIGMHKESRNFMFLHYYDPHFTYDPPEPFLARFRDAPPLDNVAAEVATPVFGRYAGEIAYVDHCIGKVVTALKELNLYDSTMIIVTSDHGEMLGQHGEASHGFFIYQPAVIVPLVVKLPGKSKPSRINNTVGLIDIVPTICSALDIETGDAVQGVDLLDYADKRLAGHPDRHLYCQSFESTKYGANSLLGVVTDKYKYIQTTRPELFDLAADPDELKNLALEQHHRGRIMQDELSRILEDAGRIRHADTGASISAETVQRLESLGYIGGGIEEDFSFDTDKEDPKDLIDYHVRMMAAGFHIHRKQFDMAKKECRRLIADRPSYFRPWFALGKIAATEENYDQAIEYLGKSIQLNPEHIQSYQGLAAACEKLGRTDDVIAQCVRMLEIRPNHVEAYFKLSKLLYEKGDYDAPQKYQSAALLEHPSYVRAAVSLAENLLEKKQITRSLAAFRQILQIAPDSLEVINALAWLQAASPADAVRDPAEAIRLAQKACRLTDYRKPEVLDTLAVAHASAGDFAKAIELSQQAVTHAKQSGNAPLAARITRRITLYKRNQPFRDPSLTP